MNNNKLSKRVIIDGIALNRCNKCSYTSFIYKKGQIICEKCGEVVW